MRTMEKGRIKMERKMKFSYFFQGSGARFFRQFSLIYISGNMNRKNQNKIHRRNGPRALEQIAEFRKNENKFNSQI